MLKKAGYEMLTNQEIDIWVRNPCLWSEDAIIKKMTVFITLAEWDN